MFKNGTQGASVLAAAYAAATNESESDTTGIFTLFVTFTSDFNVTQNVTSTGRHLLQTLYLTEPQDAIYTAQVRIGGPPLLGGQGPFNMRMDTGSASFVIQQDTAAFKGLDTTMLTAVNPQPPSLVGCPGGYQLCYCCPPSYFKGTLFASSFFYNGLAGTNTPNQAIIVSSPSFMSNNYDGILGLSIANSAFGPPDETPSIQNMINQNIIANPFFTAALNYPNAPVPLIPVPAPGGGSITLGGLAGLDFNADIACVPTAPLIPNTGGNWLVPLDEFTGSNPNPLGSFDFCTNAGDACLAIVDTGQLFNVVPPAAFAALNTFVGANSAAPLPNGLPSIPCPAVATNTQIINFVIAGRVYTLSPRQYINTYPPTFFATNPATSVCGLNFITGLGTYVLGAPFLAIYPEVYVVPSATQQGEVCFNGNVALEAKCNSPITLKLPIGSPTCNYAITKVDLINMISAIQENVDSIVQEQFDLQPLPADGVTYSLTAGQTYTFTLKVTNRAGSSTCSASVTIAQAPPMAKCTPALLLPATSDCSAKPNAAALLAAIDAGSTGGPLVLNPPASTSTGTYSFPLGSFPVTLSVTNCAGTATCSTLVTVADQETLQASRISCGALPADGVVETPLLTKDKTTPVATYSPVYTKANGCPTTLITDNLSCHDCLLGSTKQKNGILFPCDSSITSSGVNIFPEQLGRVAWTVTVEDQAGREATTDCAICADHGDKFFTTLGHCPKPFTTTTSCTFGNL